MIEDHLSSWNDILMTFPNAHFLQTRQWTIVKRSNGWDNLEKAWSDGNGNIIAVANLLKKNFSIKGLKLPFCILYIPRGPIMNWEDVQLRKKVLSDLVLCAKQQNAIFIKMDPALIIKTGTPTTINEKNIDWAEAILDELKAGGWQYSQDQIQFKNTVVLDVSLTLDELLNNMKQKTRYNIRLAEKKGVTVRNGTPLDFENLYQMYAETSLRDEFVIRTKQYYLNIWKLFFETGYLTPLIACVSNEPVAALMLFHFGETAWYVYGMSRDIHRNLMPTYLLQWEAIKTSKALGCKTYDLWGAPDVFDETDTMWGVYRFKQGLGGETVQTMGAWDLPLHPLIYKLFLEVLPKILKQLRKKGYQHTQRSLGA